MLQFTREEISALREKASRYPQFVQQLIGSVQELVTNEIPIPETALATWIMYYFCPKHSVRLTFNLLDQHHHVCPVDGEVFSGEPYDGAWWVVANSSNAAACYTFGLLWMLTGERVYFEKARQILLGYAKYYPGYEVHGNIPHNKPGKAFSQTMSDAQWVRPMAMGYDLIRDDLTAAEKALIDNDLMAASAEFLMKNRIDQTHNHEVLISISIAMIGMILNRQDMLQFAIHQKYGLLYQLDNAFLKDGFWFEGSMHYQAYIIEMLTLYCVFFKNTPHSLVDNDHFKKMFEFPIKIIQPDAEFPRINDDLFRYQLVDYAPMYEFAYSAYGDQRYAWLLNRCYEKTKRDSLNSFFYGAETIPAIKDFTPGPYHNADGSGLTTFRGPDQRYLLVKHAPFGGEHDHYDRLGISYLAFGDPVAVDFGSTGYGAKLHYDYYKNTGSHNTVVLNEGNQPPANPMVLRYEAHPEYTLLDTTVNWKDDFVLPDIHTVVAWDADSYQNVVMRRVIIWCNDYFVEVFTVKGALNATIDWSLHVAGSFQPANPLVAFPGEFSAKKPYKYLKDVRYFEPKQSFKSTWKLPHCQFNLFSYSNGSNTMYYGAAPDNPSVNEVSYIIQRIKGNEAVFVNVFETIASTPAIQKVDFTVAKSEVVVEILKDNKSSKHSINL